MNFRAEYYLLRILGFGGAFGAAYVGVQSGLEWIIFMGVGWFLFCGLIVGLMACPKCGKSFQEMIRAEPLNIFLMPYECGFCGARLDQEAAIFKFHRSDAAQLQEGKDGPCIGSGPSEGASQDQEASERSFK